MSGFSTGNGAASLWAHLNRKDATGRTNPNASTASDLLPPTGPQDRTATTMRVLLHDTQMNFEKFSGQVERLVKDVQKAEQGLHSTNALFEKEHDKLMGDIIDLVNRVQTQLKDSIGTPTQASATDALFKDVNRRLEGLDQRLDAIHAFNQTHSQALQTQMHTIQTLQSQQNAIVAAVIPLLPLLQSISSSPHQCWTRGITDRKKQHELTSSTTRNRTPSPSSPLTRKRSRSSSDNQISSSPSIALMMRKKSRIEIPPLAASTNDHSPELQKKAEASSSTTLQLHTSPSVSPGSLRKSPELKLPIQQTPRRPLQEIFSRSPGRLSRTPRPPQLGLGQTHPSHSLRPRVTPKQDKPNFRLDSIIRQASIQRNIAGPSNQTGRGLSANVNGSPFGRLDSLTSQRVPFTPQRAAIPPPVPPQGPGKASVFSSNPIPPPMLPPPRTVASNAGQQRGDGRVPISNTQAKVVVTHTFLGKEPAQFKEGKRFIPLIDTDDEEDEEEDGILG